VLGAAAGLGLLALTLFSFAAAGTWLGELTTHFRPHLAALGLAVALGAIGLRSGIGAAAAGVAVALNLLPLLPYAAPWRAVAEAAPQGVPLRVLTLNLRHEHADPDKVRALVARERPDLVALSEILPEHAPLLESLREQLPTVLRPERTGAFEVVLLTRWEASEVEIDRSAHSRLPVTRLLLCREGVCVRVVALHAARPLEQWGRLRAAQFEVLARLARGDGRVIALGDLNCTPWSPAFAALLRAGGLADSALGRGIVGTWISRLPVLGLPIDHVLVGAAVGVRERRVGEDVGSDHLPLLADLVLTE
jgi:endonuclease/exonuclease/phosphatase (EEP) superfamily protein YafD